MAETEHSTPRQEPGTFSEPEKPASPPTPRSIRWAMVALLFVTLGLRVWNGSVGLDTSRFFDERFSLRNVATLLVEGDSKPANAFYGSLSYLPQTFVLWVSEGLHELTGIEWLSIFSDHTADGWSPTAYFLCRLVCALFGTWSVWLTFLLGQRLFSPRVGLLGAAFLSAFPRHILASTEFKPDILVVALVLLTFLWSLDAARHLNRRNFLLAGAGVGLAVAAKYTGVGVAIPLTVGVLWYRLKDRQAWLYLVTAGVASIVTFVLLNLHIAVVVQYLPRIWRIMESKGEATGGSHLDVLGIEFNFLVLHHRWLVMAFVLAGCVALFRRATKHPDRWRRLDAVMVLSYIFGYSALYAAATKLFKGQNYLPVAAFTSVLAAWTLLATWDHLVARWHLFGRRLLWIPLWTIALLALFEYPARIVYVDVIPTTFERAQRLLSGQLRPLELRHVYYEKRDRRLIASTPSGHWLVTLPTERLSEIDELLLDLADAELFFADRLDEDDSDFYLRRSIRDGLKPRRIEPALFQARGPAVVALVHPWQLQGEPTPLVLESSGPNRFHATVDPDAPPTASLSIWLPLETGPAKPRRITVNGRKLDLHRTRRGGRRAHWITQRFHLDGDEIRIAFDPEVRLAWEPELKVARWRAPGR